MFQKQQTIQISREVRKREYLQRVQEQEKRKRKNKKVNMSSIGKTGIPNKECHVYQKK